MARQVYLRNYFNRFPDFHYDETKETISQFKRLSRQQQWSQDERDDERDQLRTALVMQFNDSYGEDDEDIQGWQKLCQAINLDHTPESVTECKQLFELIHVNLVDLVDTQGTGHTVDTFPTEVALATYTKDTSKFFPRQHAKAGGLLRLLLRHIMNPGARDFGKSNPKKRGPRRR
ncbi:hypothetical protein BC629DRAFT_1592291 [Irpex lacteus]|nr:hypothetical protein BC629DRAFT_1592291 [Irpex lacteus]